MPFWHNLSISTEHSSFYLSNFRHALRDQRLARPALAGVAEGSQVRVVYILGSSFASSFWKRQDSFPVSTISQWN